jgi:hypothetical protein
MKIIILLLIVVALSSNQEGFYERILKEANNTNLVLDRDESGLLIKVVTTDGAEILEDKVEYMKIPEKYIIYGCIYYIKIGAFFPFRDILTFMLNELQQEFPSFGDDVMSIYTLVYQLMYHKLADKDKARQIARDNNQYSSEFFKFELSRPQKEYFDQIIDREVFSGLLMTDEQFELVRKYKIDNLVTEMSHITFEIVLDLTKKLKNKTFRDYMLTFVSDLNLFKRFTDYVYKYSISIDIQ